MRLLFLSPFPPRPLYGGAVVRNHHLVRWLSRHHQVWASFRGLDGDPALAGELPARHTGWRALLDLSLILQARRVIKEARIEAIVATSLIAGLNGALLKRLTGRPFWMDEHNVEWHCSKRYGFKAWPLVYLLERFVTRSADYVTCVSEADRQRLIASCGLTPERVTVAPNGVDFSRLEETPGERERDRSVRRVLFFGVLNYPPNRVAVQRLATEIAPQAPDDMEFVVAGAGGEDLAARYPNLHFVGFVDDIHSFIKSCDGLVVPIVAGGGTRMKILETVACGRPVVSTTCGAEGLEREALGEALTVTDDLQETLQWLRDLPVGAEIKVSERFRETYDWETIWHRRCPL